VVKSSILDGIEFVMSTGYSGGEVSRQELGLEYRREI
jgi:hypothetical protein